MGFKEGESAPCARRGDPPPGGWPCAAHRGSASPRAVRVGVSGSRSVEGGAHVKKAGSSPALARDRVSDNSRARSRLTGRCEPLAGLGSPNGG
jgi:hypothetical protein